MKEKKPPRIRPEEVIETALDILESEGLENVSLRRIASKLGVQAPALYWHFKNKQDIVDDMAQFILSEGLKKLSPPGEKEKWTEWLINMAHTLRDTLLSRREGSRVVSGASFSRAVALAELSELTVRVLNEAGFSIRYASIATTTILSYIFGFVMEEQSEHEQNSIHPVDLKEEFPMLSATSSLYESITATELFDMGLNLIITGLVSEHKKSL